MKKLLIKMGAAALALSAHEAGAFTYSDNNLLLVFREPGFNDVEFNLGPVSSYAGLANGTVLPVTGFDSSLVAANFSSANLAGINFLLVSASSSTAPALNIYVTDADPTVPAPLNPTAGPWKNFQRIVAHIGQQAAAATGTNTTESYVVSPNDTSSYTYIASDGGAADINTVSGAAVSGTVPPTPFVVENAIAAAGSTVSPFFQLQGNANAGAPATQIGSFSITADGALTFTAGAGITITSPPISGVTRSGGVVSVTVVTQVGVNYRLVYTNAAGLTSPVSTWTPLTGVSATDTTTVLQDTTADATRFYKVLAY